MARKRLSWDKDKEAKMDKKADPYTMNQDHKNNPVQKYNIGGPSDFAEDPDMKTPWKTEGRTETGHPAPEREAVMAARKMEDKAMKCITIAQRMLPGASDEMIEDQATDYMYMPEKSVLATLQRQTQWAETLAGENNDEEEEKEEEEKAATEEEEKEAKKEEEEEEEEEKAASESEEKEAKKEEEEEEEEKAASESEEKEAKKEEEEEEEEEKAASESEEKEAKKEEKEEEEEKAATEEKKEAKKEETTPAPEKKEEKKAEEEVDLLDSIFANEETKTGAKKLSGIVKQASTGDVDVNGLWTAPPDVSEAFK